MKPIKIISYLAFLVLVLITACSKKNDSYSSSTSTTNNNGGTKNSLSLTSNSPVPAGDTLRLGAASISGASYAWTGPANFNSTLQNPTRTAFASVDAGAYGCTATTGGAYGQTYTGTINVTLK